jgi:hypothetical protein
MPARAAVGLAWVSGAVATSSAASQRIAVSRESPHMSDAGRRPAQKAGRSGRPKIAQRRSGNSWTHGTPAGLPSGIPGIGDAIEGAVQHAPQPARQEK